MLIVSASRVFRFLMAATLALVAIHILGLISRFVFGYDNLLGLIPLFNLENEGNIPTLFSCALMGIAATTCVLNKALARNTREAWLWLGLTAIFVFMGIDEFAQLHEKTMEISRRFFGGTGYFYYAWVIPFGGLALVVGLVYLRFLLALPRRTALLFVLGGLVFLSGAIGFELLEAPISERGGYQSLVYMVYVTLEEFLEMAGIGIFIYAALDHLGSQTPALTAEFKR